MPVDTRGAPYPAGTDVAWVSKYIQDLAGWTNIRPGITPMTSGERAALSGIELWDHRYVGETDTGKFMARWSGAWIEVFDLDTFSTSLTTTGMIMTWATNTPPSGWVLCDGTSYPRVGAMAGLFAVLGTSYGSLDAASFSVPNLRGKVLVGRDAAQTEFDALGESGGAKTVALTAAQNGVHNHTQTAHQHAGTTGNDTPDHAHTTSGRTNDDGYHEHTAGTYGATSPIQSVDIDVYYYGAGETNVPYGRMLTANPGARAENVGNHAHSALAYGAGTHGHNYSGASGGASVRHQHPFTTNSLAPAIQDSGTGAPHENMPPYMVLNHIIKT